jgi:uncharacterized protein with FMN-binding domain
MKKYILSFVVIALFVLYSVYHKQESAEVRMVSPNNPTSTTDTSTVPTTVASSAPVSSRYKDGEYTGTSADAYYGNIQVKTVIQNGKITDIQFLDYPNDRRTSIMINNQAMPLLRQEAIQSQNSNVDIVTGATDTSMAFRESLQSALDKAM